LLINRSFITHLVFVVIMILLLNIGLLYSVYKEFNDALLKVWFLEFFFGRRRRRNLFDSNKNTITIDNIMQQLIIEPGCQKNHTCQLCWPPKMKNFAGFFNFE